VCTQKQTGHIANIGYTHIAIGYTDIAIIGYTDIAKIGYAI